MQTLATAVLMACAICLVIGPFLIPFLHRLKFGQYIRNDGPQAHLRKKGTPTMGGLMFFLSLSLPGLILSGWNGKVLMALLVTLGFGLIGFFDDFIKVVMKRPLGLRAKEKLLGQVLLSAVFAYVVVVYGGRGTTVYIPGTTQGLELGWFFIPFVVFVMVSANNAVNLTDGLDGLAAGVTIFTALAYLMLTWSWGMSELAIFAAALVGSCLGFLFFNLHPARLFMGDTGSLTLGGAIGALAVLAKAELLLPLVGGVFVIETLAVILQVLYFRFTGGKRLLRMSPLHHHFELSGWSEVRVVISFWAAAAVCACLGLLVAM